MIKKYRLITRSDFDGLVCAVLLKHLGLIEDVLFVHPKDMQDGNVVVTDNDISTNLPYVPGVRLSFDHHESETLRNSDLADYHADYHIIDGDAPSTARVVYKHYGGHDVFPDAWNDMMEAVDKADSAQFSLDEVLNPTGWVLLNYLMDSRTGLGRFKQFRISNYHLMMDLIDYCSDHSIDEVLNLPDVQERSELFFDQAPKFLEQIGRCSNVHGNLVVLDMRDEETIYAGNRFMIYAMNLNCNISIHVLWGLHKQNIIFATGKSILNRSSKTNIGKLMLKYGGGGHNAAGTCQINAAKADNILKVLIKQITKDG